MKHAIQFFLMKFTGDRAIDNIAYDFFLLSEITINKKDILFIL